MKYLLTGYFFDGYHGSMMHLCEIAEYLAGQGNDVEIVSMQIEDEIRNYVASMGAKLLSVDEVAENSIYDYALCYHHPVLPMLLVKGIQIKNIVFGSLSSIESIEIPSMLLGDTYKLHVHNPRLKELMMERYGIKEEQIFVAPNIVRDSFSQRDNICSGSLGRIAVVSNHVPQELRKLKYILEQNNILVDYYGREDKYVPMSADILCQYDCIISIGKTVQYALALGIPVFVYDHFGGNGYITPENLDTEEYYNFSGRNDFRQLSAEQLAEELINNYQDALSGVISLRAIARERYSVSKNAMVIFEQHAKPFEYTREMTAYVEQMAYLANKVRYSLDVSSEKQQRQSYYDDVISTMNKLVSDTGRYYEYLLEGNVRFTSDKMWIDVFKIENDSILVKGWSACTESSYNHYCIKLLVLNSDTGRYYFIPSSCVSRRDVQKLFPGQCERFCGFESRINTKCLPVGKYKLFLKLDSQGMSSLIDTWKEFTVVNSVVI